MFSTRYILYYAFFKKSPGPSRTVNIDNIIIATTIVFAIDVFNTGEIDAYGQFGSCSISSAASAFTGGGANSV